MSDKILNAIYEAEEKVLSLVLEQLLKREPTIEDFKKLTRYYQECVFDEYYLAFHGLKLGIVQIDINNFNITFTPCEHSELFDRAENDNGTKVTFKDI